MVRAERLEHGSAISPFGLSLSPLNTFQSAVPTQPCKRGKEAESMHSPSSSVESSSDPNHGFGSRWISWPVWLALLAAAAGWAVVAEPFGSTIAGSMADQSNNCVLDFTSLRCLPCQSMSSIVSRLEEQGYPIVRIDADSRHDLMQRYRVRSLPTFLLLVNGQEITRIEGTTTENQLRRMLLQIPAVQQQLSDTPQQQPAPARIVSQSEVAAGQPFQVELGAAQGMPWPSASPADQPRGRATSLATTDPAAAEQLLIDPARDPLTRDSRNADGDRPRGGRFGFPFFHRNRATSGDADSEQRFASTAEPPTVVRGQSRDVAVQAGTDDLGTGSAPLVADPMQVTTRFRVKGQKGTNFGTGTIIDSRVGRTLILTCGHLFRDLGEQGVVEVDLFVGKGQAETYVGRVLDYDLAADVGLVQIATTEVWPVIAISPGDRPLQVGESLLSLGCGGGGRPEALTAQVSVINRYDGPANIECSGLPVPGRSGGGLFRGAELVGVCIAADPKSNAGVYAGLPPIYELLHRTGVELPGLPLSQVAAEGALALGSESGTMSGEDASSAEFAGGRLDDADRSPFEVDAAADGALGDGSAGLASNDADPSNGAEFAWGADGADGPAAQPGAAASRFADGASEAALAATAPGRQSRDGRPHGMTGDRVPEADMSRALLNSPDAEVICIVRPRQAGAASRVVIIHQATPKLLGYLMESQPSETRTAADRMSQGLVPTSQAATWPSDAGPRRTRSSLAPQRPASPRP
jgi:thiol-disulfide isomerase/thioredoxin